jgi:hypothetical protein
MSKSLSDVDGVWHTSVVAHGVETYYGQGIQQSLPAQTHHGYPDEVVEMGRTSIPREIFDEYLDGMKQVFTADKYDLFEYNCNHMSQQVCEFLVGKGIPDHITDLPQTVLQTPFGHMIRPMIEQALQPVVQAPTK